MDPVEATCTAEHLEFQIALARERARVECYAVPLRPYSSRRRSRWTFLIVTDVGERAVRDRLPGYRVEYLERRGRLGVLLAWPPTP